MKILRLSTFLDFGGVETRLTNVSHVTDDNEWLFVCLNKEGKAADKIKANKKRVICLNAKPSIYNISTLKKVYSVIKKEKPDVIHTSGAEANFHGVLAAKLAGIPVIIAEEIGIPNHSKKAQFIFSNVYKFANYIVGNSALVLDAVHRLDKVPKNKLIKIDNPLIFRDLDTSTEKHDSDIFKIVTISRLEPVKNIEGVIKVLSLLLKEKIKVELTIAGSGILENSLKELVAQLNLQESVRFVGFITDPYPYLQQSDLYILNSFTEGFSNSLVEAMYSKTLSLSTDVGAAPQIIVDSNNGFIVPVNDEGALFNKIKDIINMPGEKHKEIEISGHRTVIGNFSLESHVSELMKVYNVNFRNSQKR